ncbi:cytochrome P450 [Rhizopogon salebrosus TDB-379]|nr:cytochrome P450 [Rhizopogon salebrosus TDB-379]
MLDAGWTFDSALLLSAFVVAGLTWRWKYRADHSYPPLPPGPPSLPLVGSLFSLDNPTRPWLGFNDLKSTYGDIIYTRLLNKPVVVINSEEVARDLFDLRSTIYADKPQSIVYESFAVDFASGLLPYGERWRLHRRIFHQSLRPAAVPNYHPLLLRSARKMLFSFLQDPTNYTSHFQMYPASFILPIVYDYEPKGKDDHVVRVMQTYLDLVIVPLGPVATIVMETFPFLLRLPAWFPGATFKRAALACHQAGHDVKEVAFQNVTERMSAGGVAPCLVSENLDKMSGFEKGAFTAAVKEVASISFSGTSETTMGTLLVFLLAMVLYPEVQAKAQAEIDQVVGKDRLPDFDDRPMLPYMDAIMRETLRWNPVFPFGAPHATTTSDVYKGYFIPKGFRHAHLPKFLKMIKYFRAMTHNEEKYPSPNEFKPERFLHEDGSLTDDTMQLSFGWGRRICVGRHVADSSLWIAMTSFLAAFSVHKAIDEHGKEIPVIPKFSTGFIIHPEIFPCRIVPRFSGASAKRLAQLTGLGPSVSGTCEFRD